MLLVKSQSRPHYPPAVACDSPLAGSRHLFYKATHVEPLEDAVYGVSMRFQEFNHDSCLLLPPYMRKGRETLVCFQFRASSLLPFYFCLTGHSGNKFMHPQKFGCGRRLL